MQIGSWCYTLSANIIIQSKYEVDIETETSQNILQYSSMILNQPYDRIQNKFNPVIDVCAYFKKYNKNLCAIENHCNGV